MDPLHHLCQKFAGERPCPPRRSQQPTPPETAPPPYTPSESDDEGSDDEDEAEREAATPLKLTINAAHRVQGSNNLIPTSPTPLADATRFSTLLLAAVNQINNAAAAAADGPSHGGHGSPTTSTTTDHSHGSAPRRPRLRRALKVDLIINCGITVVGDRNVIGNVGLKPRTPPQAVAGPSGAAAAAAAQQAAAAAAAGAAAVAGMKRRASPDDEHPPANDGRGAKRVASAD